jgi:cytochrome c biogenesis protein CcmG/thiol:disulfide interchange protein DsbE
VRLTALIVLLAALSFGKVVPVKDRKPAADFTLQDTNGAKVQLSSLKGKIVLLNFWATWCVPCLKEIPWFSEFSAKYKAQGLQIVGVSMDDEGPADKDAVKAWAKVKKFVVDRKVPYTIVLGNDDVGKKYGAVDELPQTFLIDRTGKIASIHNGLVERADYEKDLTELLKP